MNLESVLLRQVHPDFAPDGKLTSQAFYPFPKDEGRLSAYDGDQISAADSLEHYTNVLGFSSCGVWGISCKEVGGVGLSSYPDPLPGSPAHALVDFGVLTERQCRKLAKRLKAFALARGCLHVRP